MGFQEDLAIVARNAAVRGMAVRRAGSRELGEDTLRYTQWAIARVKAPGNIRDLRAYFCKTLIHEIDRLRTPPTFLPVEDVASIVEQGSASPIGNPPTSVDDEVHWRVLAEIVLRRLDEGSLLAAIPERSPDHRRYRIAIVASARAIFTLLLNGAVTSADWNVVLKAQFPQWCDEPGQPSNTIDQRLSRARRDVQLLLQRVLPRHELGY